MVCEKGQQWPYFCCVVSGGMQVTKGTGKVYGQLVPGNWVGDLIHMKAMVNVHATTEGAIVLISSEMVAAASNVTKKTVECDGMPWPSAQRGQVGKFTATRVSGTYSGRWGIWHGVAMSDSWKRHHLCCQVY